MKTTGDIDPVHPIDSGFGEGGIVPSPIRYEIP